MSAHKQNPDTSADEPNTPKEIEAEIAEHREELGRTVAALRSRLDSPAQQAKKRLQRVASPQGLAAVGLGLGFLTGVILIFSSKRRR